MDAGLTFTLKAGQIGILRAPNGWGKTSLAESITGLLPADSGQLTFLGEEIRSQPSWERSKRGMGFLQSRENVFPSLRTKEMISLCRSNGQCDLATTFRNRRIENLSGGERQRVALTTCLGAPSRLLLILDEPFNMLDASGVAAVQQCIEENENSAILILIPGSSRTN